MNTISFKEAIKMVHPDKNPHIKNVGELVSTVMLYKNDEAKLYECMVHWNLIKGVKPQPKRHIEVPPLVPNKKYFGSIRVMIYGWGDGFIVSHTTAQRIYFTKETKNRTGRSWTSLRKVKITGVRK